MIHVGIDEAGYGPLLGPLVIGASAFRVPPGEGPSLRDRLKGIACRARAKAPKGARAGRLPVEVDDSKQIYPRQGLAGLARAVSAFAAASGRAPPAHLADLLARFGDRPATAFPDPWYAGPEHALWPEWEPPKALAERMALRGVEALGIFVSPIAPRELNESFTRTENKGRVLFLATAAVLVRVLDAFPGEDVSAVLDREGGRLDYGLYLADVFPFHEIRRHPAPPGQSIWTLREGGREVRLHFKTGGDREELSTGLASMAAKATRELFMSRLNAWFSSRVEGLKPTAGYVEDGRRFLRSVAPVLERESIDLSALVRNR